MNQKQKDALLAWCESVEKQLCDLAGDSPEASEMKALRAAFAEPEPPKAEEPVPCATCKESPNIVREGTEFYIQCQGCSSTPNCKTREGAIRVWNAMQEAARRER